MKKNVTSKKLCLSTIIRDLRWKKQQLFQQSPLEAHFV